MLSPETAWSRIEARCPPLGTERRDLRDSLGRHLAAEAAATTALPDFDTSALDGFALRGDLAPGTELPIAGTIAAGDRPGRRLETATAVRIFTGAPVPAGADRVIGVEATDCPAEERVRLLDPPAAGAAIRRRGEVFVPGARLLGAGCRLGPAALSLLASQGIASVEVVRPPRVAVLPTGDEVVPPETTPAPGQLRDSHTDFLLAAGRRLGLPFRSLPIAPDDPVELERSIRAALEGSDVVLVCGGVSMGGRDHTEEVLRTVGAEIEFDAVAVQPGKPLVFARRGGTLIFGLPGNPVSVMVAFRLFVEPALARLAGDGNAGFWTDARSYELAAPLPAGKPRDRFVPGFAVAGQTVTARPASLHGSHDLLHIADADLLLRIPAGAPARHAGDRVEAIDWE